jgi:hypothetical protein
LLKFGQRSGLDDFETGFLDLLFAGGRWSEAAPELGYLPVTIVRTFLKKKIKT